MAVGKFREAGNGTWIQTDTPIIPATAAEPRGAEIYVDGQFVGNVPSTMRLSAGTHKILLRGGKSADWQRDLQVHPGANLTIRAQLSAAP